MITTAEARRAAQTVLRRTQKSEHAILTEIASTRETKFDIFLCHSFDDRELIIGTRQLIEDHGLTVYVDWLDDGDLDRMTIDRDRADHLRTRMGQCETLFYAHTPNAALSKWCPWELGYFDALMKPEEKVFILPVVEEGQPYEGQEYLLLYETVDLDRYRPKIDRKAQRRFEEDRLRDLFGVRHSFPRPGRPWL